MPEYVPRQPDISLPLDIDFALSIRHRTFHFRREIESHRREARALMGHLAVDIEHRFPQYRAKVTSPVLIGSEELLRNGVVGSLTRLTVRPNRLFSSGILTLDALSYDEGFDVRYDWNEFNPMPGDTAADEELTTFVNDYFRERGHQMWSK